ncbi:unnamed protein product, partial [marine sediment metagenome]
MQVRTTDFALPGSTGILPITVPGWTETPKAVFLFLIGAEAPSNNNDTNSQMGFGAADGTREWCIAAVSESGQGTSVSKGYGNTGECLAMLEDDGGALDGLAEFSAFIPGGVNLNVTQAFGAAHMCCAIFLSGADLTAYANIYQLPGSTSPQQITDPGFEPDLLLVSVRGAGMGGGIEARQRLCMGAAVNDGAGAFDNVGWSLEDRDAQSTTSVWGSIFNNRVGARGNQYE